VMTGEDGNDGAWLSAGSVLEGGGGAPGAPREEEVVGDVASGSGRKRSSSALKNDLMCLVTGCEHKCFRESAGRFENRKCVESQLCHEHLLQGYSLEPALYEDNWARLWCPICRHIKRIDSFDLKQYPVRDNHMSTCKTCGVRPGQAMS
jgi:hypothetical protein